MSKLRTTLCVALVIFTPAAMLYPLWSNPLSAGEDDLVTYYPLRKLVGNSLREGRWPLDNPLEATGSPLMAAPQTAVMFPLTWLFAVMPAGAAYSVSIFVTFSLAGLGAYLYLRRVGLARPAASFGALAFQFSGFMVGHRVHLSMIQTAALLPWGLWAIEGLAGRPGRAFAALVPVGFLALAAGHWGILSYMALAWSVYVLLRCRPLGRSLAVAAAAAVFAAALAAPQLVATSQLYAASTRSAIGYATAGENSFYPAAAVLALFPFLMGSRTPNFFAQNWWGPWHLCEMLGYVGLVTLVLAAAAIWRLYRKPRPAGQPPSVLSQQRRFGSLVRAWVWIGAGAVVWMLGYYLPSFRLVYLLPVIGRARCPARMLLVVDTALAVLAAVAIHSLMTAEGERADRLRRTVKRLATLVLPAAMVVALGLVALGAVLWRGFLPEEGPAFAYFVGMADDALRSLRPWNPAVWVPLVLAGATVFVVRWSLAAPARRFAVLIFLLLADLFFVTRFVDVHGRRRPQTFDNSPAAGCLRAEARDGRPYRIYTLTPSYCERPVEMLLPKAAHALGFATISFYGTWQSPSHAHLFGFDRYGRNYDWRWLVQRNHLLSLYGVRYLIAAEPEYREAIESVKIAPAAPRGPPLPTGKWHLQDAVRRDGTLRLVSSSMRRPSKAWTTCSLDGEKYYTLSFEARGPDAGAANYLSAWLYKDLGGGRHFG
ncbi:MAG: hypothetical protein ACYTF6_13915, partial [Planctomycetota bacterium]